MKFRGSPAKVVLNPDKEVLMKLPFVELLILFVTVGLLERFMR